MDMPYNYIKASELHDSKSMSIVQSYLKINCVIKEYLNNEIDCDELEEQLDILRWYFIISGLSCNHLFSMIELGLIFLKRDNAIKTISDCLYVAEMSNNSVKIGITNNINKRLNAIQNASGLTVLRQLVLCSTKQVRKIERLIHNQFKKDRIRGEYFSTDFDIVCNFIKEQKNS